MIQSWIYLAITAAILTSAATLTAKKTLIKEHAMEYSTVLALIVLVISTPLLFFIDYSKLQLLPVVILFFTAIIGAIAFLLAAKSIRHMDISDSSPLFALGPGITAILALIFLKEFLTIPQSIGIALLIIGAYVLETKSTLRLLDPIKTFKKSKYIHYIIIALILYGITTIADRYILYHLDMQVEAFIIIAHFFLALHFLIMIHIFHDGFKGVKHGLKNAGWWIFLVALFTLGYRYSQTSAIKITNVALVLSIKRMSTLFTILIGGEIFHEGKIFRKIIATLILLVGATLIIL
jgi:drug/metabolite transporter (DMT)-like permease